MLRTVRFYCGHPRCGSTRIWRCAAIRLAGRWFAPARSASPRKDSVRAATDCKIRPGLQTPIMAVLFLSGRYCVAYGFGVWLRYGAAGSRRRQDAVR